MLYHIVKAFFWFDVGDTGIKLKSIYFPALRYTSEIPFERFPP